MTFSTPTIDYSSSLIPDVVGTFKLHTLIVVDVVTQRIFEVDIERETLVVESGEDVTIEIGIGVTNLHTVGFINPSIAILIDEVHITRLEITRRL